jgi:hypothetical protein
MQNLTFNKYLDGSDASKKKKKEEKIASMKKKFPLFTKPLKLYAFLSRAHN